MPDHDVDNALRLAQVVSAMRSAVAVLKVEELSPQAGLAVDELREAISLLDDMAASMQAVLQARLGGV